MREVLIKMKNKAFSNAGKVFAITAVAVNYQPVTIQLPESDNISGIVQSNTLYFEISEANKSNSIELKLVPNIDKLSALVKNIYGNDYEERYGKIEIHQEPGDAIGFFHVFADSKSFEEKKEMLALLKKEIKKESLPYAALLG